jgi:hypothetical protein
LCHKWANVKKNPQNSTGHTLLKLLIKNLPKCTEYKSTNNKNKICAVWQISSGLKATLQVTKSQEEEAQEVQEEEVPQPFCTSPREVQGKHREVPGEVLESPGKSRGSPGKCQGKSWKVQESPGKSKGGPGEAQGSARESPREAQGSVNRLRGYITADIHGFNF